MRNISSINKQDYCSNIDSIIYFFEVLLLIYYIDILYWYEYFSWKMFEKENYVI